MGSAPSHPNGMPVKLRKKQLRAFQAVSHFEPEEIKAIWQIFQQLTDDEHPNIDREAFERVIGSSGSLFHSRLFKLFDEDGDNFISFEELLTGLSVLSTKATMQEKIDFSFYLYDLNEDEMISKEELKTVLVASLLEHGVTLTDDQVFSLVNSTFEEADLNKDGFIDKLEFEYMAKKAPSILSSMTLDLSRVLSNPAKLQGESMKGSVEKAATETESKM